MKRYLLIFAIALAGCNDQSLLVTRDQTEDIADDVSNANDAVLSARITQLEERITELEGDVVGVRALGLENAANAESLTEAVNYNADLSNREKVAEMTKRGACGREIITQPNGGTLSRNAPCTLADLKK